jgi:hypothetical protein
MTSLFFLNEFMNRSIRACGTVAKVCHERMIEDIKLHVEEVAVINPIPDPQEAWKELFAANP